MAARDRRTFFEAGITNLPGGRKVTHREAIVITMEKHFESILVELAASEKAVEEKRRLLAEARLRQQVVACSAGVSSITFDDETRVRGSECSEMGEEQKKLQETTVLLEAELVEAERRMADWLCRKKSIPGIREDMKKNTSRTMTLALASLEGPDFIDLLASHALGHPYFVESKKNADVDFY